MHLELGATVRAADGEGVGTIDQLVVDSERRTIAYFILRTGRFSNHDYIVPIDAIRAVDGDATIHLVFTETQVCTLPQYEQENFVTSDRSAIEVHQAMPEGDAALLVSPAEDAEWRYLIPTSGGAILPAGPSGRATPEGRVYDGADESFIGIQDPTGEQVTTLSSLPEWDYRIGKNTKVVTRDGHTVGSFHEVVLEDGKPRAIVIVSGLVRHRQHTIPMARMRSASAERIVLDMTGDEFQQTEPPE